MPTPIISSDEAASEEECGLHHYDRASSFGEEEHSDTTSDLDESDENSSSDFLSRAAKQRSSNKKVKSKHPIRSIQASALLSRAQESTQGGEHITGSAPFEFLPLEYYECTCLSTPDPAFRTTCKVLLFFGLVYLPDYRAIFCPKHHQFVPLAELPVHLIKHNDWTLGKKTKEAKRMSEHIALSLDIDAAQTAGDLITCLPTEIEEPFGCYKLHSPLPTQISYQCPKCGIWKAACKGKGTHGPEWDIQRHLRFECDKGPFPKKWSSLALAEPCWTYRVRFAGGGSHVFVLPEDWADRAEDEETVDLPEFPSKPQAVPSISLRTSYEDWPLKLFWPAYDREILASDHVVALRQLIMQPRPQRSLESDLDAMETALHLIRAATVKYFKSAMVFLHSKHKRVVESIVAR